MARNLDREMDFKRLVHLTIMDSLTNDQYDRIKKIFTGPKPKQIKKGVAESLKKIDFPDRLMGLGLLSETDLGKLKEALVDIDERDLLEPINEYELKHGLVTAATTATTATAATAATTATATGGGPQVVGATTAQSSHPPWQQVAPCPGPASPSCLPVASRASQPPPANNTPSHHHHSQPAPATADTTLTNAADTATCTNAADTTLTNAASTATCTNAVDGIALLVNDEWGTSKGGISTINRQVGGQVLKGQFKVYCMVVKANQADVEDAERHGVTLIQPKKLGISDDGTLKCLLLWKAYFADVLSETLKPENVRVVIGHADITHTAALNIKQELYPESRYISFLHVIPEDCEPWKDKLPEEMFKKQNELNQHIKDKDVNAIMSVGPRIYEYYLGQLPNSSKPHLEYMPYPEPKFFGRDVTAPNPRAPKRILTFGRVRNVSKLKGYDLLARAVGKLADAYSDMGEDVPVWVVCGVPNDEAAETKEFLLKHAKSRYVDIKIYPYITHDDIINELEKCIVCLMGSRTEPFGLVGFEAIVMGVPALITSISGLAKLLLSYFKRSGRQCVVGMPATLDPGTPEFEETADKWKKKIRDIIKEPGLAFEDANILKQDLKQDSERENGVIYQSQKQFVDYCLNGKFTRPS